MCISRIQNVDSFVVIFLFLMLKKDYKRILKLFLITSVNKILVYLASGSLEKIVRRFAAMEY